MTHGSSRLGAAALTAFVFVASMASAGSAQDTRSVVDQVIAALGEGEPDGIVTLLEDRVILSVEGSEHDGVTPRQATAELARFLARYSTAAPVSVRSGAHPDADRAFAELSWALPSVDTEEVHAFVLFLGMELHEDRWLINEVRILRQA